jgi:ABC-type sugar transport system ATPase subunit
LIFQQPSLYPWLSALDNVAFGLMLKGIDRKARRQRTARPGRLLDSVTIDMPRPRHVIGADFEHYRALFVDRLRSEVTKAFQEQDLAEMLDTRSK